MYLHGTLSINPSQMTIIQKKQPTQMFSRVFHALTAGVFTGKEEQETFTAVVILQQLNVVLRSLGITNIVRLAKDQEDIYHDTEGREDDLKFAMDQFNASELSPELFETLHLVLEHQDDELKHLLDISVTRVHEVGEYPIQVTVDSIPVNFVVPRKGKGSQEARVKKKLAPVFESQEAYDLFRQRKEEAFEAFLGQLEHAFHTGLAVDDIVRESSVRILRPKEPISRMSQMEHYADSDPIYYGYHGFDDYFFYAWYWSSLSHHHHVHYHDVTIVHENGDPWMEVGSEGFDAGETTALDPEQPFESPGGDATLFSEPTAPEVETIPETTTDSSTATDSSEGGSWLSSLFGSDDSSSDTTSSWSSCGGSSCSSCSSCGGGGE